MKTLSERFWNKVSKGGPAECWLWTGATGPSTRRGRGGLRRLPDQYGYLRVRRSGRWVKEAAHRISYEIEHGEFPAGAHVAHTCDVRLCCNPAHLFLTDNRGNIADKVKKGRQTKGEAIHCRKMTVETVRELRGLATSQPHRELAGRFGISQTVASDIIARRTWRHVS